MRCLSLQIISDDVTEGIQTPLHFKDVIKEDRRYAPQDQMIYEYERRFWDSLKKCQIWNASPPKYANDLDGSFFNDDHTAEGVRNI